MARVSFSRWRPNLHFVSANLFPTQAAFLANNDLFKERRDQQLLEYVRIQLDVTIVECFVVPKMTGSSILSPFRISLLSLAWPMHDLSDRSPRIQTCQRAHCELFHLRSIPVHSSVLSFAFSRSPSHSRCHICSFHYARIFEFGIDLKNLHSSEFAFTERIAQFWLKYQPPVVDSLSLACMPKKNRANS